VCERNFLIFYLSVSISYPKYDIIVTPLTTPGVIASQFGTYC
jgi:hypothetical protein